jgi:chromosomal replication initiator protein
MDFQDEFTAPAQSPSDANAIWRKIASSLKELVEPSVFQSMILPIECKSEIIGNKIVLKMPNMVFYRSFTTKFQNLVENLASQLGYSEILISYELADASEDTVQNNESNDFASVDVIEDSSTPNKKAFSQALSQTSNLNPAYTFETFVRGPSNQFAHATCLAVADNPGITYNPLFIYGCTGLGKTHLLHAVGWRILQKNPNAVVCYIHSDTFMNEMIYCFRFNKMWEFKKKYRNCDVLLVDDIQFISGRERTQEEFFHTFNALHEAKKQIVLTSDKFPQDITDIEDRLRNRFQWGLITDIQPPDLDHRVAILMSKAEQLKIPLTHEVANYIALLAKKNVRELEGALRRIQAFASFHGKQLDLAAAQETFQNVLGEPPKTLTIETIQKLVADQCKIKPSDLKSKKRHRAVSLPRQVAMYLSRTKTSSSFPEIGAKFGGKDHTTVMHAVSKIKHDLETDVELKSLVETLERKIDQYS